MKESSAMGSEHLLHTAAPVREAGRGDMASDADGDAMAFCVMSGASFRKRREGKGTRERGRGRGKGKRKKEQQKKSWKKKPQNSCPGRAAKTNYLNFRAMLCLMLPILW